MKKNKQTNEVEVFEVSSQQNYWKISFLILVGLLTGLVLYLGIQMGSEREASEAVCCHCQKRTQCEGEKAKARERVEMGKRE